MSKKITYLTTEQIIFINTLQIRLYSLKEQVGIKDSHLLELTINQSFSGDGDVDKKAVTLFESIAKNHAFFNANKRTALASMIMFLKLNGFEWTMGIDKEQDFVVDVVNQAYTFPQIVVTIKGHRAPDEDDT